MGQDVPLPARLIDRAGLYLLGFAAACMIGAALASELALEGLYWRLSLLSLQAGALSLIAARMLELTLLFARSGLSASEADLRASEANLSAPQEADAAPPVQIHAIAGHAAPGRAAEAADKLAA